MSSLNPPRPGARLHMALLAAALALYAAACSWFDVRGPSGSQAAVDGGPKAEDERSPSDVAGGSDGGGGADGSAHTEDGEGDGGSSGGERGGSGGRNMSNPDSDPIADAAVACDASDACDAGVPPIGAEGDFTWHPIASRFAITDDPATSGSLDRVWLLVDGGATPRRLVSNLIETIEDSWLDAGIWDITSELDGVSFNEAGTYYQRVFFAREGRLQMLTADASTGEQAGDRTLTLDPIEAPQGYAIERGDLAAALYPHATGERSIVVLAPATFEGRPGFYCRYELALASSRWSVQCSTRAVVHAQTDVASAVVGRELHFYFRGVSDELVRVAREPDGSFSEASWRVAGDRPLAASLWAMPSELDGRIELIAITQDGALWNARPQATERAAPVWTQIPPPTGNVRLSTGRQALAALVTENIGPAPLPGSGEPDPIPYKITELRAIGDDGQHYFIATDNAYAHRPWMPRWATSPLGRGQRVHAIGGMTWLPVSYGGHYQFGSALCVAGGERTTTLQESLFFYVLLPWRDHLRIGEPVVLPSGAGVAELSATSGPDRTMVAVARRSPPPFEVELLVSNDGATTFAGSVLVQTSPAAPRDIASSALEPSLAYGGGRVHLTTLEWDLDASCSDPSGSPRRIVYRRATSPERLASLARDDRDVLIASGDLTDVAHPVMAITDSALGPVVHVVFNAGIDRALYYWRLPPGVSESPQPIALAPMPHGPAALAADMENRLYVASRDAERFMLCPLYPDGVARDECGIPDSTAVDPLVRDIAFGAPLAAADTPTHDCAPLGELHYRCMRDEKPFSITADKLARHRVFVAFTAADAGATSVYVTSWCGGAASAPQDCLNPGWLTPLRVNGRPDGDTSLYFDPEITVDGKGELVVSYAAVDAAPSAAPGRTFIERGQIFNDIPFHQASPAPPYTGAWDLSSVPFDCASRRWALGHQRQADIVDARSFHLVREGEGHTGRWLSEYVHP